MKDIIGYEGLYQITSCGKVWSYKSEKFLKPQKRKDGYLQVNLYKGGERKKCYIHRLVAEVYIPNPEGLLEVNHKDENKENNALPNLEWCDRGYNVNYGSHSERVGKALSKPVFCEELNRTFESITIAARELGLNQSGISRCCTGKRKTCGGFHFRYQEE